MEPMANKCLMPLTISEKACSTEIIDLSVVIPAKNESLRLPRTIKMLTNSLNLLQISHQIIVVDDGSDDRTAAVAKINGTKVIRHSQNHGITAAFKTGAKFSTGSVIMLCPADICNFDFLEEAWQASKKFDVISVSKRHPRSIVIGYTPWRWSLSNGYQFLINLFFGNIGTCTDTHYIKFYRSSVLKPILEKTKCFGPIGETEIMLHARKAGATFFEVPAKIIHKNTNSKTSIKLVLQTIVQMLRLRIRESW
jgi:glycosyltransferase involved in cell wall biosynthesis